MANNSSNPAPANTAAAAPLHGSAAASGNGNHVVIYVAPNNKRGASAQRYNAWQVGATVAECKAAGIWAADVRFDVPRGHVVLAHPSTPAARAAAALYNGATGQAAAQHKATLAAHMQTAQQAQAAALSGSPRSYAPAAYTPPQAAQQPASSGKAQQPTSSGKAAG